MYCVFSQPLLGLVHVCIFCLLSFIVFSYVFVVYTHAALHVNANNLKIVTFFLLRTLLGGF